MFKRLVGPERFRVASVLGFGAHLGFILCIAILENNFSAVFCGMVAIAITLWLADEEAEKNTRKKNKCYVIAIMTIIFLTCVFTPLENVTPALMIALIIEFAFMAAMLTETKLLPKWAKDPPAQAKICAGGYIFLQL